LSLTNVDYHFVGIFWNYVLIGSGQQRTQRSIVCSWICILVSGLFDSSGLDACFCNIDITGVPAWTDMSVGEWHESESKSVTTSDGTHCKKEDKNTNNSTRVRKADGNTYVRMKLVLNLSNLDDDKGGNPKDIAEILKENVYSDGFKCILVHEN